MKQISQINLGKIVGGETMSPLNFALEERQDSQKLCTSKVQNKTTVFGMLVKNTF